MLHRTLPTALLLALALAPPAGAAPRAHTAAEQAAGVAVEQAEDLLAGQDVRTGRELTDALREVAVGLRYLRGEERERAVSLLSRPTDQGELDADAFLVDEATPLCSANFCVHFVAPSVLEPASNVDVPSAGMAALVLTEAEAVRAFENGTLGWKAPPGDGATGGNNKVDIYLKDVGSQKLFGYAATDPGQDSKAQHSYLVVDNDFDPAQFGGVPAVESLRVTLAHEYGHVLQYGYDVFADGWHYESSAVWLEQRMYPQIQDWLRYVNDRQSGQGWQSLTELPLTAFDHPDDQPRNAKPYGTVVWNQFLQARYGAQGDGLQRATWELSDGLEAPSTDAHDAAIKAAGGPGLETDFGQFAAAVAEWRVPASGFAAAAVLPDAERRGALTADGQGAAIVMDHLTFALYDVPATGAPVIRLAGVFPAGMSAALALVARSGAGGPVTTRNASLPNGGAGGVTLEQPESFFAGGGRITAVLVNADASQHGFGNSGWQWSHDARAVAARITSDTSGPFVTSRSPAADAGRVSTGSPVTVTFSEDVAGLNEQTFVLRDARGRKAPAAVTYVAATRTAILTPTAGLADTTRYTARLGGGITDAGASPLAQTEWSFTTVKRAPRASLALRSANGRAARLLLRSRDRDRLRWVAILRRGERTLGTRSGTLRAGGARTVRVPSAGAGRVRLVVEFTDPQGNRKRFTRKLRLRR